MQLDDLDRKATEAFEGYVVRKDLVRTFSRQFPVPTYVVEFLLGVRNSLPGGEKSAEVLRVAGWIRGRVELVQPGGVAAGLDRHCGHLTSGSRRTSVAGDRRE